MSNSLEGLGQKTPQLRGLLCLALVADDDELLDQHRHVCGALAGGFRSRLPFRFELLPGQRVGDQAVAVLPGEPHGFLAIGGGQQRNRARRRIVELAVHRVILAAMRDVLSRPELADDGDRLDEPLPPLGPARPRSRRGLLVKRFARADAEENSPGIKLGQGRERLGDHGGVVAQRRTRHGRAHPGRLDPPAQRAERDPRRARMGLVRLPRLEVIAGRQQAKSRLGGRRPDLGELRHGELLVRQHVADEPPAAETGRVFRHGIHRRSLPGKVVGAGEAGTLSCKPSPRPPGSAEPPGARVWNRLPRP